MDNKVLESYCILAYNRYLNSQYLFSCNKMQVAATEDENIDQTDLIYGTIVIIQIIILIIIIIIIIIIYIYIYLYMYTYIGLYMALPTEQFKKLQETR